MLADVSTRPADLPIRSYSADTVAVLDQAERRMLDARHDFEDVSKLTKAEMARFDKEKVDDFKKALEEFTDSLALRQREVGPRSSRVSFSADSARPS